jgi:hypothetical protein
MNFSKGIQPMDNIAKNESAIPLEATLSPADVPRFINELIGFVGPDAVGLAVVKLETDLQHYGPCQLLLAEQRLPWLFAFREFLRVTEDGTSFPSTYSTRVVLLASDGFDLLAFFGRRIS